MNGTYTSQPSDTTGLGEYSDAQLVKEIVNRGVMNTVIDTWTHCEDKPCVKTHCKFAEWLKVEQHNLVNEIIGE